MFDIPYPNAACGQKPLAECGEDSSVKGNLLRTKDRLEKQLANVNAGLTVLEKQPEFANSIETLLAAMRA